MLIYRQPAWALEKSQTRNRTTTWSGLIYPKYYALTSLVCLRLITKGVPDNRGCFQMAKALCIPPEAVLSGLLILTSYVISPAVIIVSDTNWREAALIWLPTGSTKSSIYHHLNCVLQQIRRKSGCTASHPAWLLGTKWQKMDVDYWGCMTS